MDEKELEAGSPAKSTIYKAPWCFHIQETTYKSNPGNITKIILIFKRIKFQVEKYDNTKHLNPKAMWPTANQVLIIFLF